MAIGAPEFPTALACGALAIEYQPEGSGQTSRLVLAFGDSRMWALSADQLKVANEEFDMGVLRLCEWFRLYPEATALLHELECPEFFHHVVEKTLWAGVCRDSLSHWIKLGRPEVSWRDVGAWEQIRQFCKTLPTVLQSHLGLA